MPKRPVIIDCDPGIDDATAIMMMQASGRFDIKGITAVHGNVSLSHTANNALYLADLYGIDCPVAKGASRAMLISLPKAENIHGGNGLGGFQHPIPDRPFYPKPAWELIWEKAQECEGELEIFAIGPLTNIAIAALKYPMLRELVSKVVIMGGAAHAGNASPYAEFNIWQDPHAASVVFDLGFKSLTMVDLDCCYTGYMTDAEADKMLILKSKLGPLYEKMRYFKRRLNKDMAKEKEGGEEFAPGKNVYCDAVAAAIAIDSGIAVLQPYHVFCETQSVLNFGQTVVDWNSRFNQRPNVLLARSVDRDRFVEMFFDSFNYYDGERTVMFGE